MTGYHRKSLLRRLNQLADQEQASRRGQHRRRYGPEVVEALVPLWDASDRLCGKLLHALLPGWRSQIVGDGNVHRSASGLPTQRSSWPQ